MDLGPEPPAVVDLLTDRFEVTPEAPVATLVDLAARRWIDIDEPVPGEVLVRLRPRPGQGEPTNFERLVLDRVRDVAGEGPAPAAALVKGTKGTANAWQRRFRDEVLAAARAAGLCRPRWPVWLQALPFTAGVLAAAALFFGAPDEGQGSSTVDRTTALTFATIAIALAGFALWLRMARSGAVRGTDDGLRVARTWLGVRRFLADHGRFDEYPAASVRIWDRYLAHAVALDLAPLATRQLPLGAEDDRWAWSRQSGRWRMVNVVYPRLRPGWGRPAWKAALFGLAVTVGGVYLGRPIGRAILEVAADLPPTSPTWVAWLSRAVIGATPAVIALWVAFGPLQVLGALADLPTARPVEGLLLRHRVASSDNEGRPSAFWVAVDPGTGDRLRAYRAPAKLASRLDQGSQVRVRTTALLGWVREIDVLAAPAATRQRAPHRPATGPDPGDPLSIELWQRAQQLVRHRDATDPAR
jgi:hypothetical protein